MIEGKTTTGFKFKFNENRLKDMRFIEILSEVDSNPLLLPKMVTFVLGKELKDKLYEHVEKDGIISVEDVSKEMEEIFCIAGKGSEEVKKS